MNESFCAGLLQSRLAHSDLRELRTTFIVNCVFNNFSNYTTIMFNIVTLYAMRKTSSLPRTLKTLLLSLAVSDVGVGLFVQPFYTFSLSKWLQLDNPSCNAYRAWIISCLLFSSASFLGVVAVSVDRFLAVHLHLRYQELVTHKRVVIVVTSQWVSSVFVSLIILWGSFFIRKLITVVFSAIGFILTFVVYVKIYLIVRRHKNQIQSEQVTEVAQTGEMTNFAALVKSTVGVFYVYLVFLVCYLPFTIGIAGFRTSDMSFLFTDFYPFSLTLMYLNSSLNPVIYCWKMRHIRHAIVDILRNISRRRNHPSRVIYNRSSNVAYVYT